MDNKIQWQSMEHKSSSSNGNFSNSTSLRYCGTANHYDPSTLCGLARTCTLIQELEEEENTYVTPRATHLYSKTMSEH